MAYYTLNKKIVNIIGLLISITVCLILALSLIKNISRVKYGREIIQKNEAKLNKVRDENKRLEDELKKVQSEDFIEKQFRDKLGLVKEGEIVMVLPEADIVKKLSPIIPQEEEEKPKPNWQKWWELFK